MVTSKRTGRQKPLDDEAVTGDADGPVIEAVQAGLTALLRRARLSQVQRRIIDDAGVLLDRGGYQVLFNIRDWGPVRLSQVAERLSVDVSTVSRQVSRLEEMGFLHRAADPTDRRAARLTATDSGAAAVEAVTAAWRRAIAEVLADWSEPERAELAVILSRFADDFSVLTGEA